MGLFDANGMVMSIKKGCKLMENVARFKAKRVVK